MKTCFKCNIEQPIDNFYTHKQMKDGHLNKCKACAKKDVNQHRQEHITEIRAYDRKRGRSEHRLALNRQRQADNPELHEAANKRYDERYPEKRAAVNAVNNAVRDGRLTKEPCEICGDPEVEGHHDDYSNPLDVRWLCDDHHKEHHRNIRAQQRQVAA